MLRLDAWIDADISRIQFVYQYAQMLDKDSLYLNALGRITSQFGTLSISSQAWYLQAEWWSEKADFYDPLNDTTHRYEKLKAIELCEQALKNPDSSEGKRNCEQLLRKIRRPSVNIYIETGQDGLGYYETTQDASTSFFFDRLPKGVYVFEYPVFVTTAG